ncbi:uncharacterized protein BDV17DRAFT_30811 [Aspergillus undulatus]|uniref:uncharacterized protein n=1 Tax=Aspergillus undulatus TaxID=1810928 RepID=UPI003CCD1166
MIGTTSGGRVIRNAMARMVTTIEVNVRDWSFSRPANSTFANMLRKDIRRKNNQREWLIVSSLEGHSAQELCDNESFLGSDFISLHERLFCDMEEGKLRPLCDASEAAIPLLKRRKTITVCQRKSTPILMSGSLHYGGLQAVPE